MPTSREKLAFARRLQDLIARKHVKGGTQLAREFNLLHRGESPVSPQTAHKWLTGRTIPTPDKLQTLAGWLGVGVHWLHYGPPPPPDVRSRPLAAGGKYPLTPETIELASKIEALDPKDRNFLEEFVDRLYDAGKE
jgi:transcriptional regulator with XRE-family HTH domain